MSNGVSGSPATTTKHTFETGTEAYRARVDMIRNGYAVTECHRTGTTFWFRSNEKKV